ncbi:MAG: glycosyltransferase [Alphaproteobacteria bacterium]|nr:glycosyltransferase [Alphaproteobacteria bacterium]
MRGWGHVVVFAKAPRLGAVKRRLAAGIGPLEALRFYRDNTARLLRCLARDRRWRCWLAMTPDRAALGPRFWRVRAGRMRQGRGDLGVRMRRPFLALPPGPVVIIGSDIPELQPRQIAAAFRLLGRVALVFGPASDGGYWLFGARHRNLPRALFARVRWSSEHALSDTLDGIPARLSIGFAERLDDIDDAAAFERWRARQRRRLSRPSDAPGGAA